MPVTHVAYEIDAWGVGELWIEDGRVVWHELPRPRLVPADEAEPPVVRLREAEPAVARSGVPASAEAGGPPLAPTHPRGSRDGSRRNARGRDDFVPIVLRAIRSFFAGDPRPLAGVPVDLEYESEFHARCAQTLRAVPPGQVVTYGELAALAGAPGAARAAGTFCARNRLGLFVPCHRVVGAGGLGSYGSLGLAYKRKLLALEGYAEAR